MRGFKRECFGILDKVFPLGKEGLREIVPACFECPDRKSCLKTALNTEEGLGLRTEVLDRSPAEGLLGRLKRWSDKKELSRLRKLQRGAKR